MIACHKWERPGEPGRDVCQLCGAICRRDADGRAWLFATVDAAYLRAELLKARPSPPALAMAIRKPLA